MQYQAHAQKAKEVLFNYLTAKNTRISRPLAIEVISLGLGCRPETAQNYLNTLFTVEPRLKTDFNEVWLEQ